MTRLHHQVWPKGRPHDVPLATITLDDSLRAAAARLPDKPAIVFYGRTTSYGALARQLGDVTLSRAVGQAMGANPIPLIIPCHRVLASNGRPGGFSAPGGALSKLRMLALEGVSVGAPAGQLGFGF